MCRIAPIAVLCVLVLLTEAAAQPKKPSVESLKLQLKSKSGVLRMRVLTDLAKLGPDGVTAAPEVELLLKSEDVTERLAASAVLVCFDPKRYDEFRDGIKDALRAKEARNRSAALGALRLIGSPAKADYGEVIAALFSECEGTAPFAAFADQTVLRAITDAFGPPPKTAVPVLATGLADTNPMVRHVADCLLWQAVQAGNADPTATFLPLLKHKEGDARKAAIKALARCEKIPASVLGTVAEMVADPDTRPYAIEILVRAAPASREYLSAIQKVLPDDAVERAWIAARIDPDTHGETAAKAIAARIDDLFTKKQLTDQELRRSCWRLAALGPLAKSAAPVLGRCLAMATTRENVCNTLLAIGPAAVPELRSILRDPKRDDQHDHAVWCVRRLGFDARDAVPELVPLLKSGVKFGRPRSIFFYVTPEDDLLLAFLAIGPDAARPEVLKALKSRLRGSEKELGQSAIVSCVGQLGPKAKDFAPELAAIVVGNSRDGWSDEVKRVALRSLMVVDPKNPAVAEGRRTQGKEFDALELALSAMLVLPGPLDACEGQLRTMLEIEQHTLTALFTHFPDLQDQARRSMPEDARGWHTTPLALAVANPKDLPLVLKALERSFTRGELPEELVVEVARLGPAANSLVPAVRRFLDKQPVGLACVGEGVEPERKGGCMFCSPSRTGPGLVAPPEPFVPQALKEPMYVSVRLRLLAADTLTKITPPAKP